jgi:murein DD-endopeptidase MepM/ murein hydrolase activator NlpD
MRRYPPRRQHPLPRIAIAAAGLAIIGVGWRLTSAEPASAAIATVDSAMPADYVPEDSAAAAPFAAAPPVDPLAAMDAGPAGPGAPLDFLRVTSSFGLRRHPILGFTRMHQGVDFAAREGAPVLAAEDGVVTEAGPDGGYGNIIRIRHAGGWATGYAHLSGFAPSVAPGAAVSRGEVIGFVGQTGLATGPHLHYEVSFQGVKLDPMKTPFGSPPQDDRHAGGYASVRLTQAIAAPPATGAPTPLRLRGAISADAPAA